MIGCWQWLEVSFNYTEVTFINGFRKPQNRNHNYKLIEVYERYIKIHNEQEAWRERERNNGMGKMENNAK